MGPTKLISRIVAGTVFLIGALPLKAHAMPNFAQAYGVQCSVCHTQVPALNAYGRYIQRVGYAALDPHVLKREYPIWFDVPIKSAFTALTAAAWNIGSMAVIRFVFGMGEAGAFPIATRSLSRWMRPSERGYAQGVTHAGSRLGAALAPTIVAPLMVLYGWRMPFVVRGLWL